MKLDCLGTLAEISPYYSTLDGFFRLIISLSSKSKAIWEKCSLQFSKIITRRKIRIDNLKRFFYLTGLNYKSQLPVLSLFQILELRIQSRGMYKDFCECWEQSEAAKSIQINRLMLSLSLKDNFDAEYDQAWIPTEYGKEDREIDADYNRTIELIREANIDVVRIDSMIYLDEVKFRKIKHIGRVVWIIREDMEVDNFLEHINFIQEKNINVDCISLVLDYRDELRLRNDTFKHYSLISCLPWRTIEIFVNSQHDKNAIAFDYFKAYYFKNPTKVIHLNSKNKIWNYDKYFQSSESSNNDLFWEGIDEVSVSWINDETLIHSRVKWKSVKLNVNSANFDIVWGMLKTRKLNQIIIEFDQESGICYSNKFSSKWPSNSLWSNMQTSIYIDLDSIQKIYYKNSKNVDFLALWNLKHLKVINYDFTQNMSPMIDNKIYKKLHQTIFCDISGIIYLSKPIKTITGWINRISNWAIRSLFIILEGQTDSFTYSKIFKSLSKISRLSHLALSFTDPEVLSTLLEHLDEFRSQMSLHLIWEESLDAFCILQLKSKFKKFSISDA